MEKTVIQSSEGLITEMTQEYKPEFAWYFRFVDDKKMAVALCDHGNQIDFQIVLKHKYGLERRIRWAQQQVLDRVNICRKVLNPALKPIILGRETEVTDGKVMRIVK